MDLNELVAYIESNATKEFASKCVSDFHKQTPTRFVMDFFGRLGKAKGFVVAADTYSIDCPHADQGSWLYDMAWWTEDNDKMLSRLDVVLESELKPGGSVLNAMEVDGDFQKLVQARAGVRIWLTLIPNTDMVKRHINNCKSQIAAFKATMAGDTYIFIVGDWSTEHFVIEKYYAGGDEEQY